MFDLGIFLVFTHEECGQMLSSKFSSATVLIKPLSFPSIIKNPKKLLILPSISPKSMSSSSSSSSWACATCTFINTDSRKPNCQICSSSKPNSPFSSSSSHQEKWSCKACTFLNPYKVSNCEICGTRNSSFSSSLSLDDDELKLGSSAVGNVFLPLLQRCTDSKNKIGDQPVEVVHNSVDFGASLGLNSAKQKALDSGKLKKLLFFKIIKT